MGTEDRNHQRVAEMSLKAALAPLLLCLVSGAPQPQGQSVSCRTEYSVVWDTQYQEKETQECVTNYEKVCHTIYEKSCSTVYKSVCVEQYKTEYEPYTETECTTDYKEDCEFQWEGYGNNKVWAKIPGTCKQNPYDKCQDVTKTKEKQVAYPVCNDVPEQKCVSVPRQECVTVPDQVCTNQPLQKCQDVPRQACQAIHKKVPVRVSRQVPKKVCQDGHPVIHNDVPANNLVPSPVSSLPEILDARRENEKNQNTLLFERSQVADTPSDNAIVFGD